jgi:hypothetical protein
MPLFSACSFVSNVKAISNSLRAVAVEGYRLVFDNELPVEVRNANQDAVDSVGMLETMRIKVFIMVRRALLLADIHASFIPWAARVILAYPFLFFSSSCYSAKLKQTLMHKPGGGKRSIASVH